MTKDEAFALMKKALEDVLPDVDTYARTAKNTAARKKAQARARQIREALQAAREV